MPNYVKSSADIHLGGGDLKVNLTDSTYGDSDSGKFVSVGGTDKDFGGVLYPGERRIRRIFRENDLDEPAKEWVEGQDVFFETVLMESSLENFVLSLGEDPAEIADQSGASPKYKSFRGYTKKLPRRFPFIYEVPQETTPTLKDVLIMPSCEVEGVQEIQMADSKVRGLKLRLRLHRVIDDTVVNLIANGDFLDYGNAGVAFANWTITAAGTSTVAAFDGNSAQPVDSNGNRLEPIKVGVRSCKVVVDASNSEGSVSQNITTVTSGIYRLKLWHLSTGIQKTVRITVGATNYDRITSQTPNRFGETVITFVAAGTSTAVKVRGYSASSTFYFDAVRVERVFDGGVASSLSGRKYELRRQYA